MNKWKIACFGSLRLRSGNSSVTVLRLRSATGLFIERSRTAVIERSRTAVGERSRTAVGERSRTDNENGELRILQSSFFPISFRSV